MITELMFKKPKLVSKHQENVAKELAHFSAKLSLQQQRVSDIISKAKTNRIITKVKNEMHIFQESQFISKRDVQLRASRI